jgi:hypothetical protein
MGIAMHGRDSKSKPSIQSAVGWTGVAAAAALVIGAVSFGSSPAADDSAADTLAFTVEHRGRLLAAMTVLGFAMALTLAFLVGLWVLVRSRGSATELWSSIAVTTGVGALVLGGASLSFVTAAAYRGDAAGAETVRSLWDLYLAMIVASNILTVLSSVGFALAILAHDVLPRWAGWASLVVAAAHLVASVTLARSGVFSPTGALSLAAGFAFLVWMGALSLTLVRTRSVATH